MLLLSIFSLCTPYSAPTNLSLSLIHLSTPEYKPDPGISNQPNFLISTPFALFHSELNTFRMPSALSLTDPKEFQCNSYFSLHYEITLYSETQYL
ncbi:hypothetical protein BY996DRAFT_367463 [Phakopsora pachyrhizi]|nr:hypothetical protein BY996DRAFT_367463 [Phakopsora pachyrhizi]